MTSALMPYPDYQDSGQQWVGSTPRHWSILPNRALFSEVKDRDHPDEEMLSVTITQGIVRQKTLLAGTSKKDSSNQDKFAYKLVRPRDIAYNKMRAWQGAIGASEFRGIISPAYVVMRLRDDRNLPRYFHHLYRTPHFAKEAERWSYGITSDMWSLRPEHFKMIYTPQPPPDEQAAIVRFLDWASGRVELVHRHIQKIQDHYPLGTPTIGTAEVSSRASQREAKPPPHLLSESVH
jgi:type I restriction enzyme S subunit